MRECIFTVENNYYAGFLKCILMIHREYQQESLAEVEHAWGKWKNNG